MTALSKRAPTTPKHPRHPGHYLRDGVLAPLSRSVTAAAHDLAVSRPALSAVLNGRAALSGEMAIRFEQVYGQSMDRLMLMQAAYDIARARAKAAHLRLQRYNPGRSPRRASRRRAATRDR